MFKELRSRSMLKTMFQEQIDYIQNQIG